jgi:hypothetical protein
MTVFGYGEDALSFWAFTGKTKDILGQLADDSSPSDVVLFYRPSFGRQGSSRVSPGSTADSSQFGEFDAILGTPRRLYLIEAKWSRSPEVEGRAIVLRPEQLRRHRVFKAYRQAWQSSGAANWTEFCTADRRLLSVGDIQYPLAPLGSQLGRNLEKVLQSTSRCGSEVMDVVLYVRSADGPVVDVVSADGFRLITIDCPAEAGFIDLATLLKGQ